MFFVAGTTVVLVTDENVIEKEMLEIQQPFQMHRGCVDNVVELLLTGANVEDDGIPEQKQRVREEAIGVFGSVVRTVVGRSLGFHHRRW